MSKVVGLDWAAKGWFGVILRDDGRWDTDLFPTIWSVWKRHSDADRILIDVPIGLPAEGRRICDVQAKQLLGPRGRSVFYTPTRAAVYEQNLETAKEMNESQAGFSIQNQAWSIVPRIREVDEFLDMNQTARDRLAETHPEVCFYGLNNQTPVDEQKTTASGVARRRELLAEEYPEAGSIIERCRDRYTIPRYAPMVRDVADIVDALAAAVTARRGPDGWRTVPRAPATDDRGLPMQIHYPGRTQQTRLSALNDHG